MKLKDKVALIMGSSRGMGRGYAMGFAKEGADLIINGRTLEKAKPVAKEIESLGVRTMAIGAYVSSSQRGMTGYHPMGFLDLIAEMKKKASQP